MLIGRAMWVYVGSMCGCVLWWPAGYLVLALVLACGAHGGGGVISGFWGFSAGIGGAFGLVWGMSAGLSLYGV